VFEARLAAALTHDVRAALTEGPAS
jgi:hypothetical protein